MAFPDRLAELRKERGFTQQVLADKVGVHVIQIRRYEGANAQPTLDVIRRIAIALAVSSDTLIFEDKERDPDEELRYQFETIKGFPAVQKKVIKTVLDSLILQHEVKRYAS